MAALQRSSIGRLLHPQFSQRPFHLITRHHPSRLPAPSPRSAITTKHSNRMSSTTPRSSSLQIQYSEGCDPSIAQPQLHALVSRETGPWELTQDGRGIKRDYKFKSFKRAWAFMSAIAERCNIERHHPEWSNVYNQVSITWTTHRPRGLSLKDLKMASFCDEQAALHEEIVVPPPFPTQS